MAGPNGEKAPKTSGYLMSGSILSFASLMLILMSFASPYWLASWQDTYSPFQNMGLWEFCFRRFRYPNYQFDKLFDGCHYVFSPEYFVIWEWLLPGWLMAVQTFVTLALMFSCSAQILSTLLLVRWPLNFVFRYQWQLLGFCTVLNAAKSFCLLLAVAIFGGQCWRRDWLLYPNFNYLSWSYALAVIAMILGIFASYSFFLDSKKMLLRKKESSNLVVQMHATNVGSQIYL